MRAYGLRFGGLLADLYHLAKMGENVAGVLNRHRESLLHVQVADPADSTTSFGWL